MSDISPVEQIQVDQPKVENAPSAGGQKVTEQDINAAVRSVIKKAEKEREKSLPQPEVELTPTANINVEAAEPTVVDRLVHFPRKGLEIVKTYYKQGLLTATVLTALVQSGCGNENPITPTSTPEPTPAVVPSPDFKSQSTHILQPYTPQPPTEIPSTLTPTPDTPVDIRKTSKVEKKFINNMKSKYGLEVKLYLMQAGADKAIYGAQTLSDDEVLEIERSINSMPYCPNNFYDSLIIGKVPEGEPYLLGTASYPFKYIELNIPGDRNHMKKRLEKKTFSTQEPFGKVLAHECGHMINYRIMHLSAANYPDTPDGRLKFFSDMLKIPEDKNPLYVVLSELTDWQFDGTKYKKVSEHPIIKAESYIGSIDEFMAEMFAMFKYRPDLLSKKEFTFFNNLENGVSKEGDRFLKKVIENPKILLESQFNQ